MNNEKLLKHICKNKDNIVKCVTYCLLSQATALA